MLILYSPKPCLCGDVDQAHWLPGEVVPSGVKTPNGKYLSVQPDVTYQERDALGGPYEQISVAPDLNVLIVKPRVATFKIPFVEQ